MFGTHQVDPQRVAVYIRWSTEEQGQGTTLEVQKDACSHFLKSQGWVFREDLVFVDEGYSGGSMDRPALGRLRAAVQAGDVAAVVVYKLDRLSRNLLQCVTLVRQEWSRIALFSTMERFDTQSSIGQMVFNILVSFAEFERNVIRERTMSGKKKRAEQGRNSGFRYPFGYRKAPGGGFEIDPEPAALVRRMFTEYLGGIGYASLAERLNAEGIPAPNGGRWRVCTISAMMRNPFYAGHFASGYYTREGEVYKRKADPDHVLKNVVPAIVSQAEFDMARAIRKRKAAEINHFPPKESDYVLSTILRCGLCEGPMVGHGNGPRKYYRCANAKDGGPCRTGGIPKEDIEEAVVAALREHWTPERLAIYVERAMAANAEEIGARRRLVEQLTERVEELHRKRDKLDADYFEGHLDAAQYGRLSQRLTDEMDPVLAQLDGARNALKRAEQVPVDVGYYESMLRQMDVLETLTPEQTRHVVRSMLKSVAAARPKTKGRYNTTPFELVVEHLV